MKALLLQRDDGISARIWLEHLRDFLARGRQVLVISDASNLDDTVGLGDERPSCDKALMSHPGLTWARVAREEPAPLLQQLRALPPQTVVMWNLPLSEWLTDEPSSASAARWQSIGALLREQERDEVAIVHVGSDWFDSIGPQQARALACVPWTYVAGSALGAANERVRAREVFSEHVVAFHFDQLVRTGEPGLWQVACTARAANIRITGVQGNPGGTRAPVVEALEPSLSSTLASNPAMHEAPAGLPESLARLRNEPGPRTGPRRVAPAWPLVPGVGFALALLGYGLGLTGEVAMAAAVVSVLMGALGLAVAMFAAANDEGPMCYSLLPSFVGNLSVLVWGVSALLVWLASAAWAWLFIAGFTGLCALETLRNVFVRFRVRAA